MTIQYVDYATGFNKMKTAGDCVSEADTIIHTRTRIAARREVVLASAFRRALSGSSDRASVLPFT